MTLLPTALCQLALLLAPAAVQDDAAFAKVEVRVTTTAPGSVIIDRGSADGLMRGDRVVLHPKEGAAVEGFVEEPLERIARVELGDSVAIVPTGTNGEVHIARARMARSKPGSKSSTTRKKTAAAEESAKPAPAKGSTRSKPKPTKDGPATASKTPDPEPDAKAPAKKPSAPSKRPSGGKSSSTQAPATPADDPAEKTASKSKPKPKPRPTGAQKGKSTRAESTTKKKPATTKKKSVADDVAPPAPEGEAAVAAGVTGTTGAKKAGTGTGAPGSTTTKKPAKKPSSSSKTAKTGTTSKPKSDPKADPKSATVQPAATGTSTKTTPDHPAWSNQDEEYKDGKPLLSSLRPLRPEERSRDLTGKVWLLAGLNYFDESNFTDSLARTGAALDLDNPFGEGGAIHFDGEINYRKEQDDGHGMDLLIRRISYSKGGTRFDPTHLEVGRFLQTGMPEFGYLDGVEWGKRTAGGDRFGASVGYLPELDDDFESLSDLQFAGWYQWVADESERFSITGGYQLTFHDAKRDRDLVIGKMRYLPGDGWDLHGALWIDFYGDAHHQKEQDVEITQAYWSWGKHYAGGSSWDLTYRLVRFPDIDREGEFTPFDSTVLDHNRLHKLSGRTSTWLGRSTRMHAYAAGWVDEDEEGGSGELGFEFPAPFIADGRLDFTGFGTAGQFTTIVGGRVSLGGNTSNGRWDVFYECKNHHEDGFVVDELEDALHQRAYASQSFFLPSGWTFTVNGGINVVEDDFGWAVGCYVQRSF